MNRKLKQIDDITGDEETAGQPYELDINKYIQAVETPKCMGIKSIEPKNYFVTSGDAISKSNQLLSDFYDHAHLARKLAKKGVDNAKTIREYESHCWKSAEQTRKMITDLKKVRGKSKFLETEWLNGTLMCIAKNPRPKR